MWIDDIAADSINHSTPAPLHSQLSTLLRASIADGSLPPGSQLPTENELQDKFGISRSVVRQALASLSADGLIQRGRGRGSVVAPHLEHHRHVQRMPGLSAQISSTASPVRTEVLALGPGTDARAAAALGTVDLLELRRRRSTEGETIAVIQTWLPLALAGSLQADDLTDASLHAILRTRFGVPVTAGRRQVRAVPASEGLARELAVAVGSPLLLLEGTSLDDHGTPVEYFSTWHRGDRVVFDVDVVGDGQARVSDAPAAPSTATPAAAPGPATPAAVPVPDTPAAHRPALAGLTPAERVRQLAAELESLAAEL